MLGVELLRRTSADSSIRSEYAGSHVTIHLADAELTSKRVDIIARP